MFSFREAGQEFCKNIPKAIKQAVGDKDTRSHKRDYFNHRFQRYGGNQSLMPLRCIEMSSTEQHPE